jgi:CHAT domain-containing protein
LGIALACLLVGATAGCRAPSAAATTQAYRDAWSRLRRGDVNASLQEADQWLKRFPDENTEWHWNFRTLKAEALLRKRASKDALDLLRPDPPESLKTSNAAVWRNLTQGSAAGYLFQFGDADRYLAHAQSLAAQNHPELLGEVELRQGTLAYLRGNVGDAAGSYRAGLQTARANKDPFLETAALGSLGLVATREEHYDESIDLNRAALQLSQQTGAEGSTATILGNMAWSLFELGDYDRSRGLFQEAEDAASREGNAGAELNWKIDVGALDSYLHDYATAESVLQSALGLAKKLNEPAQIATSLNALATVAVERGELDVAETHNQQALPLFRKAGNHSGEIASELIEARVRSARSDRAEAERILQGVASDAQAGPSERWEAQARLASVYAGEGRAPDAEKEFRNAIATSETARRSVSDEELRLSFFANTIEFYDDYVEFLVAQHREEDALDVATRTHARTLVEGLGLEGTRGAEKPVDWSVTARREHATILSYWLGAQHSYLWVIAPAGGVRFFTLAPAQQIDEAVRAYEEAMLGPRDPLETANGDGRHLYEMLVKPAAGLIPRGSRVVVAPDGSLFGLNFEALLVEKPVLHYWIDDVTLVNANSLLLTTAPPHADRAGRAKLLLFGDPVSASAEFPVLPQARAEMMAIEHYFPVQDTRVIAGGAATPDAYMRSEPAQFAYIHFVAHGISSQATPLESAVVLSPSGDQFKLYGRDIVKMPIGGALVTISACHGVGARNFSGEGLVGLSWAFLRAGARGVVAALWEVDDASTATLMDHFYGAMSKGRDPASALRAAQLALLHSGSVYAKPFYWAPFQYFAGR